MSTETPTSPAPLQSRPASAPAPSPAATAQCPRCGSANLGRGYILTDRPNFRPAHFVTKGLSLPRLRRLFRFGRNTLEIECAVCRSCGYLMLEVDPKKLEQVEHRYPA
jgi:hypothetical protein